MRDAAAPASVRVPFGALDADYRERRGAIDAAISRVLSRGRFILGEEVAGFERELAAGLNVARVAWARAADGRAPARSRRRSAG